MADPASLIPPATLSTTFTTANTGGVYHMMMSYPGRPPMVPMQPGVGMPYMPMTPGAPMMPTIMPMPSMMGPAPGLVPAPPLPPSSITGAAQNYNKNRNRKQPQHSYNNSNASEPVLKQRDVPKGPPVTVFIGNITEKAPDLMIRHILSACGHVASWKRVQAFGFCEFGNPDAALRSMRILHDLDIGGKKLVVKVDAKTQAVLDEFKLSKQKLGSVEDIGNVEDSSSEKVENSVISENGDDYMNESMRQSDQSARKRIEEIVEEYKEGMDSFESDLEKPKTGAEVIEARVQHTQQRLMQLTKNSPSSTQNINAKIDLDTVEYAEDGKRDLITREIGKFREIMKRQEEEKEVRRRRKEEKERQHARSPSINGRPHSKDSGHSSSSERSISPEARVSRNRSKSRDKQRDRDRDRDYDRDRDRDNNRERTKERDRNREREHDKEREQRDRERDRETRDREREAREREKEYEARERERELRERETRHRDRDPRENEREIVRDNDRDRDREKKEDISVDDEEERRKSERATREKEIAYQERLRAWETRERHKGKEAAKEKERRRLKEEERQRQAKRLKEFLEDYDDQRDDSKYYRGREMQRRMTERQAEIEADNRDRQKEKEELEELKTKIFSSESVNPELEYAKLLQAREDLYKPKIIIDVVEDQRKKEHDIQVQQEKEKERERQREREREQRIMEEIKRDQMESEMQRLKKNQELEHLRLKPAPPITEFKKEPVEYIRYNASRSPSRSPDQFPSAADQSPTNYDNYDENNPSPIFNVAPVPAPVPPPCTIINNNTDKKKKKLDIKDVFNNEEDEDENSLSVKRRKLVPLDYNDDKKSKEAAKSEVPKTQEEKRKHIKTLIDKIPTDKSSLFQYPLDWSSVDNTLMEKRIRPWINKKIIEYIGEPEPTLVDFICSKVLAGSEPQSILDDVQMVLDEEAEVFVVKMWRLLIYEVEAKKLGIMK